jgi:NAD(P)-dependent dehydrogenase (short-subunit alcohol dehydrogenase family)
MDNLFLAEKTAIVTGGTRGIGRAIAVALVSAGARVAICGRTEESVSRAVGEMTRQTGGQIVGTPCDITDPEDIRKFFAFTDDYFNSLDVLVNNAGIGIFRKVAELAEEDWNRTLDTNLTAVFHFCRHALKRFGIGGPVTDASGLMKGRDRVSGGFVINIGSLAGRNAFSGGAAYNASKFGLIGFSEALMLDHRHDNLRVCTILPGSVATGFASSQPAADWKIRPEDVADVVLAVLRMPARTLISSVEMRPSKPMKS